MELFLHERYQRLRCKCNCFPHCGGACPTENCNCQQCMCPECIEKDDKEKNVTRSSN